MGCSLANERAFLTLFKAILLIVASLSSFMACGAAVSKDSTLRYLTDTYDELTINDIYRDIFAEVPAAKSLHWQHSERSYLSLGFHSERHWFSWRDRLPIGQHADPKGLKEYFLELPMPSADYLNVWVFDREGNELAAYELGDRFVFDQRPVNSRKFVVPFIGSVNQTLVYVVSIKTTDALRFDARVLSREKFIARQKLDFLVQGVYLGIIFSMIIYNFSLFIGIREKSFLYYLMWIPMISISILADNGYGFQYLWPDSVYWNDRSYPFFNFLGVAIAPLFFSEMVNVKKSLGRNHSIYLYSLSIVAFLFAITSLFVSPIFSISSVSIVSFTIIYSLVYILIRRSFQGDKQALLLLLAFTVLVAGATGRIFNNFGLMAALPGVEYYIQAGAALEVLLLSLVMSARVSADRRARLQANKKLIETQKNMYAELERVVEERTAELKEANALLEQASITDTLTQLKNRHFFDECYKNIVSQSSRTGTEISVLMIDIDHFKSINDRYGHQCGDACLSYTGTVLADILKRNSDLVARYGGEEFIVVISECNASAAEALAEDIRETLSAGVIDYRSETIKITCSIGVSSLVPCSSADGVALIRQADIALYEAKANGRNCVSRYDYDSLNPKAGLPI